MAAKRAGFILAMSLACLFSAAATLIFLSYVGHTARVRIRNQYTEPDYIRYLGQGYDFDAVSRKRTLLLTVTDEDKPVRVHILSADLDKKTLEVFELPPMSYIIADGFSGTLSEAYETTVYRELISRALCLKIDGSASLSAEAVGGAARLLGVESGGDVISYEEGEDISSQSYAYTAGDEKSLKKYHAFLAKILSRMSEQGAAESFSELMNLLANKIETSMSIEETADFLSALCVVPAKKMNIRVACGYPAEFGDSVIWCLDREKAAEQLNRYFRVKDEIYLPEALGIPKTTEGKNPFSDIKEKVSDIIKEDNNDNSGKT